MQREYPSLSIIIPAFNEALRIEPTLRSLEDFVQQYPADVEVIIVDDGSTDATADKACSHVIHSLILKRHERNLGKGAALTTGILEASKSVVLLMDADNATPVTEVYTLLNHLKEHVVVIGSRHAKASSSQPRLRQLMSRVGNKLIQWTILPNVQDTQCGFKLVETSLAQSIAKELSVTGWSFDMEFLLLAQNRHGACIQEVPVQWQHIPQSRLRPLRASLRTLYDLLKLWKGAKREKKQD